MTEAAAGVARSERKKGAGGLKSERRDSRTSLAEIREMLSVLSARSEELLAAVGAAMEERSSVPEPPPAAAPAGLSDTEADLEHGLALRRATAAPVDQPLALICQAPRSGGTLLGRLFDGHPQCHAHPHELHIGDRRPHTWPELAPEEKPASWYAKLEEEKVGLLAKKGKRKIPLKVREHSDDTFYPFLLPPGLQRAIFLDEVERRAPISSEREVLDCYMTSLFNAWIDNQNLRGAEKKWVVAFSPRRAWGDGLAKFFSLYPDGRLISILRDPWSWYASAVGRDPEASPAGLIETWQRSTQEMLDADGRYGERVTIVRFDDLLLDTPATMRRLAGFLEIEFDDCLTTPTFNGYPVGANSSYGERRTGVVTDPVERYKEVLSAEQQELIRGECEELHRQGLVVSEHPAGSAADAT